MSDILKILCVFGLVAMTAPAQAQDTSGTTGDATSTEAPADGGATGDQAPADETPPDTTEAPGGFSAGEVVTDPNAPGTTYTRETIGDWELRCIRVPEGQQEPCQLYQLLQDQGGNSVAEINLINLPEGQKAAAGATIVAPLETLLTEQLTLAVDGGPTKRYPFTWCAQVGCFSRIGLSDADIASFKNGAKAVVTIVPAVAPDQKVTVTVSLTGFTKGYEAVTAANIPADAPAE